MNYDESEQIVSKFGENEVIQRVTEYLSKTRQQKILMILQRRLHSIQIALESPADLHNAAAVLRSCEAFGVLRVHIIGQLGRELFSTRVTQGAYQWLDIKNYSTTRDFLTYIQNNSIQLYGAQQGDHQALAAIPVNHSNTPICLIFGNEQMGLSQEAIHSCHGLFSIPMYGFSESLNLSVSVGISLYDVCQRKRAFLREAGDLTAEQLQHEKAIFYTNNVDRRVIEAIFKL